MPLGDGDPATDGELDPSGLHRGAIGSNANSRDAQKDWDADQYKSCSDSVATKPKNGHASEMGRKPKPGSSHHLANDY